MKVEALKDTLRRLKPAVDARATALFSSVWFDGARANAWDTQVLISLPCGLEVEGGVSHAMLSKWLGGCPADGEVKAKVKDGSVRFGCGRSSVTLSIVSGESAPKLPNVVPVEGVGVLPPSVLTGFARCSGTMSTELGRYAINGLRVRVAGRVVQIVGTDGRHISSQEQALEVEMPEVCAVLPEPLVRALVEGEATLQGLLVRSNEVHAAWEDGGYAFSATLDVDFPDCDDVLRQMLTNSQARGPVPEGLKESVKRLVGFHQNVKVTSAAGTLSLSVVDEGRVSAEDELDAPGFPDGEMHLDGHRLLVGLQFGTTWSYGGDGAVVLESNDRYVYALMSLSPT